MARPDKQGLDYFPFDVDFFEDEKIAAISGEYGIKGEIIAIRLLCAIYREGYFILWSEMLKMKLLRYLPGVSIELLDAVVNRLVKWGFFDEALFNSDMILTSTGVQKRFFQITKRRKSSDGLPYLLVNAYSNEVIAYKNPAQKELLHTKNPQSKVKNNTPPISTDVDIFPHSKSDDKISSSDNTEYISKGNINDQIIKPRTAPPSQSPDDKAFSDFQMWLNKHASNVTKMKEPFTKEEYLRIREQYDAQTVKEILLSMHNKSDLRKKNVSANLTFRKWVRNEQKWSAENQSTR